MADRRATGSLEESRSYKSAAINASSSGDNTIVAAVTSPNRRVKVYSVKLNVAGTVALKFKDGAGSDFEPAQPYQAREGYTESCIPPSFLYGTTAGNALILNLDGAIAVTGIVRYWDDDIA